MVVYFTNNQTSEGSQKGDICCGINLGEHSILLVIVHRGMETPCLVFSLFPDPALVWFKRHLSNFDLPVILRLREVLGIDEDQCLQVCYVC